MSQAASPTNRTSIFGWVKNLKRAGVTLSDSVNEVSEADLTASTSKSPTRSLFSVTSAGPASAHAPIPFPSLSKDTPAMAHSHLLVHLDLLRPLLNHKSRSTNNVNRIRSNSASNQSVSHDSFNIRQHRDSFMQSNPLVDENLKYFGVPLADAINEASAKISILGSESLSDDVLQYGRIPIVVAKCGVYLKKNGLSVEGIFRVGGLSKRIKELQIIFSTPPEYGKKLNWDGYTVHDAALVLRRYLNALPEPLIPLDLYEDFRDPLRSRPRIIKYMKYKAENPKKLSRRDTAPLVENQGTSTDISVSGQSDTGPSSSTAELSVRPPIRQNDSARTESTVQEAATEVNTPASETPSVATKTGSSKPKSYRKLTRDVYNAIDDLKLLLDELPGLSRQLLFYILDLLAMVQNNSKENLMSSRNLAAIFQPSILLHPSHDMDPEEYALSQAVVEFLIQYAYKLLPRTDQGSASSDTPKQTPSTDSPSKAVSSADDTNTLNVRTSGRPHSRSLSSPNHLDMVGYQNSTQAARGLTLSDAEFASGASSDEDCGSEAGYGLPKPSAAPNLLHVVGPSAGKDEPTATESSAPSAIPPITISHPSQDGTSHQ